jgi:chromosome segregation ATPase
MYTLLNNVEGCAARLYRTPSEIRRDLERIASRIEETSEMLSVHNLLMEMIPIWAEEVPEKWIPELEETLEEANEALETLKEMKTTLEELKEEFEDARCLFQL